MRVGREAFSRKFLFPVEESAPSIPLYCLQRIKEFKSSVKSAEDR